MTGGDCVHPFNPPLIHYVKHWQDVPNVFAPCTLTIVSPLLACCLIALDKCPGVRHIGIGDTSRRIMSKAVLKVVKGEIQQATGSKQLCTGQISDVEVAIHMAMFCEGGHRGSASHRCKQYFQFSKSQRGIAQHPVYLPQAFYSPIQHIQSPLRHVH